MNAAPPAEAAVDVVIAVHDSRDDLAQCVDSVLAHTAARYRLVLIDAARRDFAARGLPPEEFHADSFTYAAESEAIVPSTR
jgi:hypothetical protein